MSSCDFAVFILTDESSNREELLKYTATLYSGLDSSMFKKAYDEQGKPYFNGLEGIKYSISHSGEYWACAFGTEDVGLDLQRHDECRRESIANRFFHEDEKKYLKEKGYVADAFFEIWSKKESYIKYVGKGLSLGLESFSVLKKAEEYEIKEIPFKKDYSLYICARTIGQINLNVIESRI